MTRSEPRGASPGLLMTSTVLPLGGEGATLPARAERIARPVAGAAGAAIGARATITVATVPRTALARGPLAPRRAVATLATRATITVTTAEATLTRRPLTPGRAIGTIATLTRRGAEAAL